MSLFSALGTWWRGLFMPKVPEKKRSAVWGDLTEWEQYIISNEWMTCPDCAANSDLGVLVKVAEGGGALNVQCNRCGARFNLLIDSRAVFGSRIPTAQKQSHLH